MSALPPYSTFRTDNRQMKYPQATSHGNILTFTPPGLKHSLNVKFPDSRLPVCFRCKKNYKTKDMCRVRNSHTTAPWTTAYICLTLDDSCTDENGKFIKKPLAVRMVQWRPYCVREPFGPKTPVCSACKRTNRTKAFCRERHKHRQLPWCTVYCLLSAAEGVDPSTLVAAPSTVIEDKKSNEGTETSNEGGDPSDNGSGAEGVKLKTESIDEGDKVLTPGEVAAEAPKSSDGTGGVAFEASNDGNQAGAARAEEGDDINDIADSRTFLVKASCDAVSVHWLELADNEPYDTSGYMGTMHIDGQPMAVGPAMHGMVQNPPYNYMANQMHQNTLQEQQQRFFRQYTDWQTNMNQQSQMHLSGAPARSPPGQPLQPQQAEDATASSPTAGEAAAAQQIRDRHPSQGPPPPGDEATNHQQPQWVHRYPGMYRGVHPAMYHPPPQYQYAPTMPPPHAPPNHASPDGVQSPVDANGMPMHHPHMPPMPPEQHQSSPPRPPEDNERPLDDGDPKRQRLE